MKSSHYTSILWMIYGFVLIMAITAVLEAAVYAYMHYGLVNGYMTRRFSYYIPCFSSIIYSVTTMLLVFLANRKLKRSQPLKLPKILIVVCIIVAIGFQFFTEKVSDWHLSVLFDDLSKTEYMSSVNFGKLFDIIENTTLILRWVCIVMALLFFLYQLKTVKKLE